MRLDKFTQRGQEAISGDASIAMFGNTNQPIDVMVQTGHLFAPMPDIEADPDDTQSMVRLLLYSNEIDIRGLIATTSVWQVWIWCRDCTSGRACHCACRWSNRSAGARIDA